MGDGGRREPRKIIEHASELSEPDRDDGDQAEAPPTPTDEDEQEGVEGDED